MYLMLGPLARREEMQFRKRIKLVATTLGLLLGLTYYSSNIEWRPAGNVDVLVKLFADAQGTPTACETPRDLVSVRAALAARLEHSLADSMLALVESIDKLECGNDPELEPIEVSSRNVCLTALSRGGGC